MDKILVDDTVIRNIKKEDNKAVEKLIRSVMAEYNCIGEGYSCEDPEMSDMYSAYKSSDAAFFIIQYEHQIVSCGGFAPLANSDKKICELRKMYFYQKIRGLGLGKKLLQLIIKQARAIGFEKIYLETVSRMEAANKLYQNNGFKALKEKEGHTGHSACDSYYIKQL